MVRTAGSIHWYLGDWLVYGYQHYGTREWGGRVPGALYERLAIETGMSVQSLKNAKHVCSTLPPDRRPDGLTYSHAQEVVALSTDEEIDRWAKIAVEEKLTIKELRVRLKSEKAKYRPEPEDRGVTSLLEISRQFVRDFQAEKEVLNPRMVAELKSILAPVLDSLGISR